MTPHTGISALPQPAETWTGTERSASEAPYSQAETGFADLLEDRQAPSDDRRLAADAPAQPESAITAAGAKAANKGSSRLRATKQALRPASISITPNSSLLLARSAGMTFSERPLATSAATASTEAKPLLKKSLLAKSAEERDATNSQAFLTAAQPLNHPTSPKAANSDRTTASSRARSENVAADGRNSLASAEDKGGEKEAATTAQNTPTPANMPGQNPGGEAEGLASPEATGISQETATQPNSSTATEASLTETEAEAGNAGLSKTAGQTLPPGRFKSETTDPAIPKEVLTASGTEAKLTTGDDNTADSPPDNSESKERAKWGIQSPSPQTSFPPTGTGGMSDASSNSQMNLARKMNEFAPATEQLLPAEGQALNSLEASATGAAEPRAGRASENPWGSNLLIQSAASSITAQTSPAEKAETPVDTTSQVEKLADLVARQAVELKKVNALQMNAVLRPDAQTELHLSLRLAEGKVEVHAQCTAENQQALSAQWSQIQQALAPQGIRLANLNDSGPQWANHNAFGGTSNPANQQSSNHQEARRQQAPASSEEDNLLSATVSEKTTARTPRISRADGLRWESWA